MHVDDRRQTEPGRSLRVGQRLGGQQAGHAVIWDGHDHGLDLRGSLLVHHRGDAVRVGQYLGDLRSQSNVDAGLAQLRLGRTSMQLGERNRRDADVGCVVSVQQPRPEDLHRQAEAGLIRRKVERRQPEQIPEISDRSVRLTMSP